MSDLIRDLTGLAALGGVVGVGYLVLKNKSSIDKIGENTYTGIKNLSDAISQQYSDVGKIIGGTTAASTVAITEQIQENYNNLDQSLVKAVITPGNYVQDLQQGIIDGIAGAISSLLGIGSSPSGSSTKIDEIGETVPEPDLNAEVKTPDNPTSKITNKERQQYINNVKAAYKAGVIGVSEYAKEISRIMAM